MKLYLLSSSLLALLLFWFYVSFMSEAFVMYYTSVEVRVGDECVWLLKLLYANYLLSLAVMGPETFSRFCQLYVFIPFSSSFCTAHRAIVWLVTVRHKMPMIIIINAHHGQT